jgi:hypothetical protein
MRIISTYEERNNKLRNVKWELHCKVVLAAMTKGKEN